MDNERLFIAASLAGAAAWRLILWRWHVGRDRKWLADKFGASPEDDAIARTHSMMWAAGFSFAALVVLYA